MKAIDGLEAVAEIEWADGGGVTVSFVELYPDDAHLEEVWRVIEGLLEPTDKAGAAAVWFARSFATSHVREAVELARPIVSRGPRYAEVVHYLDEQLARRDA